MPIRKVREFLIPSFSLQEYGAGRMLTGEVKQRLTQVLTEMVERHRRARAAVTDEVSLLHSLCEAYSSSSSLSKVSLIALHPLIMLMLSLLPL